MEVMLSKEKLISKFHWKKVLSLLVRIGVSLTIFYFIFSLVSWHAALTAYASADINLLFIGASLMFVNLGIRTFKWRIMLHTVKQTPSWWESFGSVMLGISLGSFTPGEIGEYAGRALHISNAKKSHLVGLTLLDKAQLFVITSLAGMVGIFFFFLTSIMYALCASLCTVSLLLVLFFRMDILAALGHTINASFLQKPWLTRILDGFTLLSRRHLLSTFFCTLFFHSVLILQMYFFLNAFEPVAFLPTCIGASAMMFVKSCLPISLSDLGVREASSIFFFSAYGVSQVSALNASILLFIINIFFPSVLGIFFLRYKHLAAWDILKSLRSKTTS